MIKNKNIELFITIIIVILASLLLSTSIPQFVFIFLLSLYSILAGAIFCYKTMKENQNEKI